MPTNASVAQLRAEFDAIARLSAQVHRPAPGEDWVIANLPGRRGKLLEIGCGVGDLARRMAGAFDQVTGIDLSPGMIAEATRRNPSIELACSDMFDWLATSPEAYDCIVSVATLHHVDLSGALRAMADGLAPGGTLLVVDLCDRRGWRHLPINAIAWLVSKVRERRSTKQLRDAYLSHGENETYLTLRQAREIAERVLSGARVQGHLLWRYSIAWTKRA